MKLAELINNIQYFNNLLLCNADLITAAFQNSATDESIIAPI